MLENKRFDAVRHSPLIATGECMFTVVPYRRRVPGCAGYIAFIAVAAHNLDIGPSTPRARCSPWTVTLTKSLTTLALPTA